VELQPTPTLACAALAIVPSPPPPPNPTTSSLKRTLTLPSPPLPHQYATTKYPAVRPNTISPPAASTQTTPTHLSFLFPLHPPSYIINVFPQSSTTAALRSSLCFLSISRSLAPFRTAGVLDLLLSTGLKVFSPAKATRSNCKSIMLDFSVPRLTGPYATLLSSTSTSSELCALLSPDLGLASSYSVVAQ
jgi:hypothetical protein